MSHPKLSIASLTKPYLFQNGFIMTALPPEDLDVLTSSSETYAGKRGTILFRQRGFPKSVVWVIKGKIKIFQQLPGGQRSTTYIYSDGDLIGFRQMIAQVPNPVTAILLEDSSYKLIPGEIFRGLIQTSPFFARNLLEALAREFIVWTNRLTLFTAYPVRYRLVLALLILHEQYHLSGSPPGIITITRTELAEFIGASLETVVRTLNTLKADHLIQIKGRQILLRDTLKLMRILNEEA